MKQSGFLLVFIFIFFTQNVFSQKITYAEYNNEDIKDMNFEILGKMKGNYLIYKNIRWKHNLTIYDNDMKIKETIQLKFVPEKTFNVDFVTYPDHFYMIYQYQKNKIVYCMGVKIDADGNVIKEPIELDTTKISILADNKIYNTVFSQDKQKILIYKRNKKSQQLTTVTKLFDAELNLLDSIRSVTQYDDRREFYGDMFVDNEGKVIFTKETKGQFRDNIENLDIYCRRPGAKDFRTIAVDLKEKYIDESRIKIDNLNNHYFVNTFFYTQRRGNIQGLYTLVIDAYSLDTIRSAFNVFPDSIRSVINKDGQFRAAFDDLFIRETIVKKDGGFLLTTENFTEQGRSNQYDSWNRSNYYYNSPVNPNYDYYLSNPNYGYYRPFNSFSNRQSIRYYYENVLIMSVDKDLNILWNSLLLKSQADDENDNYLSFSTMNVGGEIHFLFNEGERNRQIISNQSVLPDGQMKRYPTLKSRETGFEFMPRHAKQVGFREVIVPCVYRTIISFAKVVFFE